MLFKYKAKNTKGKTKEGQMEAKSQLDLARRLRSDGFYVLEVEEVEGAGKKSGSALQNLAQFDVKQIVEKITGVPLEEKMMFSRNLAVMIDSGIPISRALEVLGRQTQSVLFRKIIADISQQVQKGKSISEAVEKYPKTFGTLYSSMIRAGETAGNLDEALNTLAEQLERQHELRSRIRGAMVYPAVIITAMVGVGVLMMITVVPQLKQIFSDLDIQLPATTRFVIGLSDFMVAFWWVVVLSIPAFLYVIQKALQTASGKRVFSWVTLHTPVVKGIARKFNNAGFARTLSSLTSGGVPILEALEITSGTLSNVYFRETLTEGAEQVRKGKDLHDVLSKYDDLYTPLMLEMVEVGEESGKLSELLQRTAVFYEGEVSDSTENLASIVEPVLMVLIGSVVGFFAVSVMQPMYGMLSGF